MNHFVCCFCGHEYFDDFGNNPAPVNNDPNARCCDSCNFEIVVPARLKELGCWFGSEEEAEEAGVFKDGHVIWVDKEDEQ